MIAKTENPLNLDLLYIQTLIDDMRPTLDRWEQAPTPGLLLTAAAIKITIMSWDTGQIHEYSLEQLLKLQEELSDPVINAVKEIA